MAGHTLCLSVVTNLLYGRDGPVCHIVQPCGGGTAAGGEFVALDFKDATESTGQITEKQGVASPWC